MPQYTVYFAFVQYYGIFFHSLVSAEKAESFGIKVSGGRGFSKGENPVNKAVTPD